MDISSAIDAVYRRALLLRQYALEAPVPPDLLEKALQELYFVLEELQTSQEELQQQNQQLIAAQQAVELERQRYQTLFELAPSGYLVTNLKGTIQQANHYAAALLFCTPREYLINKPLLVFIHESDRPDFQAQFAQLSPGRPWEVRLQPHNGTSFSVAITVTRIKDTQQGRDMLLWSLHDITFRKQMEQQLKAAHDHLELRVAERTAELFQANIHLQKEIAHRQQAEQKTRDQAALIDIATDAIMVQDLDQRITFWSQGAERLYGWTSADMIGQQARVLFAPDAVAQLATGYHLTVKRGSWQDELNQVSRTGHAIVVASRWTLVNDAKKQPQSILVVNTDITEKKHLETQVYRAQRIDNLGLMASSIVHDLNNILAPILVFAEIQSARQQALDPESLEAWKLVKKSTQQGVDLVRQINLFARGTVGKPIPLHLEDVLLEMAQTMQRTLPNSIQMITDIPSQHLSLVAADPTQLRQVILNLCVNARDAMPLGGTLTLALSSCNLDKTTAEQHLNAHVGDYVVLTVADTGLGIPASILEHIFEPFFTTKAPGEGTGLGLATVFSIVKHHGGFIDLLSQPGQGSQFKVYLPAISTSDP